MCLKIKWSVKTPWHRPSMGVAHSGLWAPGISSMNVLRACFHGVGDPGLVGLVSFVFTLWRKNTKETYPTKPGSPTPCKQGLSQVYISIQSRGWFTLAYSGCIYKCLPRVMIGFHWLVHNVWLNSSDRKLETSCSKNNTKLCMHVGVSKAIRLTPLAFTTDLMRISLFRTSII